MVKPFKVNISDQIIKDIYDKVKKYPWTNTQNMNGWEHGTNLKYLKEISKYWITIFVMGMLGLLFDVTIRKIIDKTIPWRGKG